MDWVKLLKFVFTLMTLIIFLSACSDMSSGTSTGGGNMNAFGVPPSQWDNLTPAQQKAIIHSHMGIRSRSAKKSKENIKAAVKSNRDETKTSFQQKRPFYLDAMVGNRGS